MGYFGDLAESVASWVTKTSPGDVEGLGSKITRAFSKETMGESAYRKYYWDKANKTMAEAKDYVTKYGENVDNDVLRAFDDKASKFNSMGYIDDFSEASRISRASAFFGDEEYGGIRKGVVGGAVAGGAVAARFATGGSLTRNGNGEKDIIGIPFV